MNLYTASQFTICLKQAFLSSFAFPLSFFLIGCLSQKVRAASGWGFSGQSVSELNILQISSLFEITQTPKKKTVKTSVSKIIRNWESFLGKPGVCHFSFSSLVPVFLLLIHKIPNNGSHYILKIS